VSRECLDSGIQETLLACAELVARASGIAVSQMLGYDRHPPVANARHVAIWATRQRTDLSYPKIGRLFGGRDHRTAMNACERVSAALVAEAGGELAALAQRVRAELLGGLGVGVGCDDVDALNNPEGGHVRPHGADQVGELFVNDVFSDAGNVQCRGLLAQRKAVVSEVNRDVARHSSNAAPGQARRKEPA
jgi:hypothetical protein